MYFNIDCIKFKIYTNNIVIKYLISRGIAAGSAEVNNNTVKQEWENGPDDNRTISW